jgi:hypothetical protein
VSSFVEWQKNGPTRGDGKRLGAGRGRFSWSNIRSGGITRTDFRL